MTVQNGASRREKERTRYVSCNTGRIIGPDGCIVRAIEAQFGVKVKVQRTGFVHVRGSDNKQLDRAAAAIDNIADGDGAEALQLLSNHLRKNTESLRPNPVHESVHVHNVPSDMVPHLIGKGGARIRRIVDETGVAQVIYEQEHSRFRVVGPASQCRLAAQRIQQLGNSVTTTVRVSRDVIQSEARLRRNDVLNEIRAMPDMLMARRCPGGFEMVGTAEECANAERLIQRAAVGF